MMAYMYHISYDSYNKKHKKVSVGNFYTRTEKRIVTPVMHKKMQEEVLRVAMKANAKTKYVNVISVNYLGRYNMSIDDKFKLIKVDNGLKTMDMNFDKFQKTREEQQEINKTIAVCRSAELEADLKILEEFKNYKWTPDDPNDHEMDRLRYFLSGLEEDKMKKDTKHPKNEIEEMRVIVEKYDKLSSRIRIANRNIKGIETLIDSEDTGWDIGVEIVVRNAGYNEGLRYITTHSEAGAKRILTAIVKALSDEVKIYEHEQRDMEEEADGQ